MSITSTEESLLKELMADGHRKPCASVPERFKETMVAMVKQNLVMTKQYDHTPAGEHHEKKLYYRITDKGKQELEKKKIKPKTFSGTDADYTKKKKSKRD